MLKPRDLIIALAAVVAVMLFIRPASPWEFDEILFYQGLHHFDPLAHHPPPPGYPLFMAAGSLVRAIIPTDLAALTLLSIVSSCVAFVFFSLAFANLSGSTTAGLAGSLVFYLSPAMLVHSTLPISDTGALALLAVTLYFGTRLSSPASFAAFAALTIGWRPQFSIFVVPLLFANAVLMRRWRDRAIVVFVFTIVCLMWLGPLAISVGGFDRLVSFEASQAGYLAAHDADQSRSGWTPAMVALRFIAHPWGTKLASFPLLLLAMFGAVVAARRRERRLIPFGFAAVAYLGFALWTMDPADGVRYALPFVVAVAFAAGIGSVELARLIRIPALVPAAVFAAGALWYVWPVVAQRRSGDSPPVQAALFARAAFPSNAVALYELPLWPHAQYYFGDRNAMRVNDGLAAYYDRPEVPLFIYADGASSLPGARTFRWAPSDAYSKLTRNHYRVVSIIPVPRERRFRIISGVYMSERETDGEEWRWLASPAELQLPHGPARTLSLRVGLPTQAPIATNSLSIYVGGRLNRVIDIQRGRPAEISIPVPAGAPVLRFVAGKTFVPANVPGSLNRDPRTLAVKLYDLATQATSPALEK